ncbi:sulfite exporter TauE/SafE family protein [Falsirhodobacter sp. 20TX0035]|uniref:sulfite exporter TauE/SafE family protein n=1 Tax=Falsirhodobacter sp. 20TX0035 TaxID=3022019 RepID=UPI00232C5557|nr:sulfite exporter TauE/SafE family protein [Falsirhodobacter sp. 20TX0035]MDB6453724.1 sulfite exporter TauE/SafE family protein [Falsirhodobacter sp. 20TX0035]
MTEVLLLIAGLLSGAVNTLAGGGSFIMMPTLILAGVPPLLANATNTYAALPGYVSGAAGFWPAIRRHRSLLLPYSLVAILFGWLGAELLLVVSDEQFAQIVPWLMLVAVLLFTFGRQVNAAMRRVRGGRAVVWLFLAAVCVYGGFFNAGLGILLLAFLALAGLTDLNAMNGLKLWISALVALVAVVKFALGGVIAWYYGSIGLVGVTLGAWGATQIAHLIPARALRIAIILYGVGMTGWFFWKL